MVEHLPQTGTYISCNLTYCDYVDLGAHHVHPLVSPLLTMPFLLCRIPCGQPCLYPPRNIFQKILIFYVLNFSSSFPVYFFSLAPCSHITAAHGHPQDCMPSVPQC